MTRKTATKVLQEMLRDCTEKVTEDRLDRTKLGRALRNLRTESGISLRSMAKMLEVSPAYLSDMELAHRRFKVGTMSKFVHHCLNQDKP